MPTYVRTQLGKAELKARYGKDGKPIVKDGLKLLAEAIKKRVKNDHQVVVGIDGDTGSGKSNLAVHLALLLDPKWNIEECFVYDVDDLRRAVRNINTPYPVLLFDEGSIILNSKNSLKKEDKGIVGLFDTLRYLHVTFIICCPNVNKINKTVLHDHMDYRLICPSESPIKGYDPRGCVHVHDQWKATWTDSVGWPFIFTTSYPKMSKPMQMRYDRLKRESSRRIMNQFLEG